MMTQKYGTGVFKAKKHLAFLKSLHAHANGGPKGTNIEEATLLCSCIGIGKPISKEDVCKVCDTYAANREHISKSSIKEVFLKAQRINDVLAALRVDDSKQEAEEAAGAAIAQQEVDGEPHVAWAAAVLASGVVN